MNLAYKKVGIWGLGVAGKATLRYLLTQNCTISVAEQRALTQEEHELLASNQVTFFAVDRLEEFFLHNEVIIPSAGIDLRPFKEYAHKWITELDLFYAACQKPVIAITGTVGKTTITHLISEILTSCGKHIVTGGNIGVGMLGMLPLAEHIDYVVLEVSSFQLEHCTTFAPHLAIWTNLSSNHLDRHETMANYFAAKYNIIAHQSANDYAVVPENLLAQIKACKPRSHVCAIPTGTNRNNLTNTIPHDVCYPDITYPENWRTITVALDILGIPVAAWINKTTTLSIPHHRLEKIDLAAPFAVYNDSKSTTNASTLAAVQQLSAQPIHLLIGGISKGADRSEMINALPKSVVHAYCFGKEAQQLDFLCAQANITSSAHATLEDAVHTALKNIQPNEQLLLSPGGASFDLFANYQERGTQFKNIVQNNYR